MEGLERAFLLIVNMSLTAAYAALVIILFRSLFLRKLPKILSYSLWGILLFRLLSPVSFASAFSVFNLLQPKAQEGAAVAEYLLPNPDRVPLPFTVSTGGGLEAGQAYRAATTTLLPEAAGTAEAGAASVIAAGAGGGMLQLLPSIAALIWVLGVAALIAHSIAAYFRVTAPVKTATLFRGPAVDEAMRKIGLRRKVNVYASDRISSPFVTGFPIPRIYIPAGCPEKDLPYLLTHELVHVKRLDYLIRPLSYLLVILHWFNPFMWLSFNLMSKDM